jgi:hypothetical protein
MGVGRTDPWVKPGGHGFETQEHPESRYYVRDYDGLTIYMRADRLQPDPDDPGQVTIYRRGGMWMACYSDQCHEGEYGHVYPVAPGIREITREEFHEARRAGWPT